MKFFPKEVLFSPTYDCNLNCSHCDNVKSTNILSKKIAARFLHECKGLGIKRVSFTGGEPFLAPEFLFFLTKSALGGDMLFGRIMTNAVWYKDRDNLKSVLGRLFEAGYDGDICISVDAFHRQDLKRIARFIETALSIWKRPDIISIACTVCDMYDPVTKDKLGALARILRAHLAPFGTARPYLRKASLFIKIFKIKLSAAGKAEKLKDAWGKKWFREDLCRGPGDIFFVEPSGDVKPCCGYATDSAELTIGNIRRDSAAAILENARRNRFVSTIFNSGLSTIRKALEKKGIRFLAKTEDHCYFCNYILKTIPKEILTQCLD